jgi:hypothetical protein
VPQSVSASWEDVCSPGTGKSGQRETQGDSHSILVEDHNLRCGPMRVLKAGHGASRGTPWPTIFAVRVQPSRCNQNWPLISKRNRNEPSRFQVVGLPVAAIYAPYLNSTTFARAKSQYAALRHENGRVPTSFGHLATPSNRRAKIRSRFVKLLSASLRVRLLRHKLARRIFVGFSTGRLLFL